MLPLSSKKRPNDSNLIKKLHQYFLPAGDALLAIDHTKDNLKDLTQKYLYKTEEQKYPLWHQALQKLYFNKDPILFSISSNAGASNHSGANWGPMAIRYEMIKKGTYENFDFLDIGDVFITPQLLLDEYLNQDFLTSCQQAIYLNPKNEFKLPISPLSITIDFLKELYQEFPKRPFIALGGDHSISYATISSYLKQAKKRGKSPGILHFSAHSALIEKDPILPICSDSWANHISAELLASTPLIEIGIRSRKKEENKKSHLKKIWGAKQILAREIQHSISKQIKESIKYLKTLGVDEVFVSLNINCLDAEYAQATPKPEKEGPTPDLIQYYLQALLEEFSLGGADLVEVAPYICYNPDNISNNPMMTAYFAASFVETLLDYLN